MRIYSASDLIDFIWTEVSIECHSCHKTDITSMEDEEFFFNRGWRATKDNVYCPECAKKKLKLK